jgi:Family of unknown function (DUF5985)
VAEAVYVLCTLTSLACAWLLLRSFAASGVRLLLWSGLCFVGLALNNALLFVDKVVAPDVDLSVVRILPAALGLLLLLGALIWERER